MRVGFVKTSVNTRCSTRIHQTSARCAQKTVAFHFEFGSEVIENARYEMQTLYSMENLQLAKEALGRTCE